jgi:hypothetical protein
MPRTLKNLISPPQQLRQLSNINSNALRLIEGQRFGGLGLLLRLSCVDVNERLPVGVEHLEASRYLLDLPWWWEPA